MEQEALRLTDQVVVEGDRPPLPFGHALMALARCFVRTVALLSRRKLALPADHVGDVLEFADGSHGRVYRETAVRDAGTDEPTLLVVGFRLRWVRGPAGHALFRAESLLNTMLFAGFRGLVTKLWLAADENGIYRGVYQWNDAALAHDYVRALWWVLALVSEGDSIHYVVLPGLRRDDVLADPSVLDRASAGEPAPWWCLTPTLAQQPR